MRKQLLLCLLAALGIVFSLQAQNSNVTGKVTDEKGTPLAGVSITVKGTKRGTLSSQEGNFTISASPKDALIFSAVGYAIQEASANLSPMKIVLVTENNSLNEVVVTALGIRREKRMLTYATQEVKGTALLDAKQENIVNGLSGKVAGVQITNSSGQPGSSAQIVIRGNSSLTGDNTALFVVDGIPIDNGEAGNPDGPLGAGGTSNRGIDIDPNIIESVTVLKGTAATALYGSSASRGAILITTKSGLGSGKLGKPVISFSSSYTFATPLYPDLQNKWAQGLNGQYIDGNAGQLTSASWGPLIDTLQVDGKPVTKHNQLKEFFREGHTTDNNVSVSGSTDKSNYIVSYSFLRNDGIIPTTDFIRNSFFAKYNSKFSNKVNLTTQFNYVHSDNDRTLDGNSLEAPLWTVLSAPISWNALPSVNPDGTQRVYRAARNNPYWLLDNTGLKDKVDRILPSFNLSYTPLPWLTFTERLGADMYFNSTKYHESIGTTGSYPTGRVYNRQITYQQFNNDLIADARGNLTKNFFAEILLGNNVLTNYNDNNYVQGVGLSIPDFYNISNATTVTSSYGSYRSRKIGFYAQLNFEYKRMLTVGLTGRYDGSSVLSADKQFYPYGSASAAFIFTEAFKMNESRILNFGKVRISYSGVGNDAVLPYSLTNPYYHAEIGNVTFPFNGQNGYLLTSTYGYPVKNEAVKEFEIGLETKWLQNRISLDVTYFNKKSTDLLTSGVPVDATTGFNAASQNSGSLRNRGIEATLGLTPIKTKVFTWNIQVNYTRIKNDVLELAPNVPYLQFAGFTNPGIFAFPNSPYGVFMARTLKEIRAA